MPKYTRRHYEATAATIKSQTAEGWLKSAAIIFFADMFEADNKNFQRERFLKACSNDPQYEVTPRGKRAILRGVA